MSDDTRRIIDQDNDTSLSAGDYVVVDSQAEGTRKFDLGSELSAIKEDLEELQEEIEGGGGGGGMSADFKQALHNILEKVAFVDEYGQTYLDALDSAMYPPVTAISLNTNSLSFASLNSTQQLTATTTPTGGSVTWSSSNTSVATVSSTGLVTSIGYGSATITATSGSVSATCSVTVAQATLVSISAVYTQSGTVYASDSLDSLKSDLVVTAHWSNSSTSTVPAADYTLSGSLTVGTSTITVTYSGKTTTFNVTVSSIVPSGYTQHDYLALDYSSGTVITGNGKAILVPSINFSSDYTYEFEFYYPTGTNQTAKNIFGARTGTSGAKLFGLFYTESSHKLGYWIATTDTSTSITNISPDTVNTVKILPVGASETYPNNVVIVVNGTEFNSQSTASGSTFATYLGFFKYATSTTDVNSSTTYYYGLRIGRLTVKNGDTVVYDFIPANNGTYSGYYERITGTFYTLMDNQEKCISGDWS